jgi:hypothetical protein
MSLLKQKSIKLIERTSFSSIAIDGIIFLFPAVTLTAH